MSCTHGTSKDSEFRTCTCCGETFPNTEEYFYKNNKDGLNSVCKSCSSKKNKERNQKMKSRFSTNKIEYEGEKICKKCGRSLPNSYLYFPVDKTTTTGLRNICRECDGKYKHFLTEDYSASIPWTKEEDNLLIEYYKNFTGKEIQEYFLPNRSIRAIECHAGVLGIQGKTYEVIHKGREIAGAASSLVTKGRKMSDEQKQLISIRNKEYYKTHTPYWLGRKRSDEQRKQISERMKGKWAGDKNPRHLHPLNGSENGRWKGGINSTYAELRSETKDWQKESMEFCNYQCVISGGWFDNIHHTIAFRDIVDEAFVSASVEVKDKVMDYLEDDFDRLKFEVHNLHDIYGYGACIHKDIHKLFHDEYGYTGFTPFDFLDFIYRIDCGEFDKWFDEHNLSIKINCEYVNYLEGILLEMKSA